MASKKAVPKKAAKTAKPVKKAPAAKPVAAKKTVKPAAKKAAPKKAAPAAKAPAKKSTAPASKKTAVPVPSKKAATAGKPAAPARQTPAKAVAPVKKPAVAANTKGEVKPAIKPLEKQAPKAEAPKPQKVEIPKTSTSKSVKYEPEFTKSVLDSQQQQAQGQPGPTMRYSDVELAEFRDLIQRKLDTAKKELAYLQGLITRKDESGDLDEGRYMTMEDGSMSMEREQLSQMASRQIQFIDHLEKAIMRIENKTYGICRVTGKLIDKARLRAVPHATLSIEAKQMRK